MFPLRLARFTGMQTSLFIDDSNLFEDFRWRQVVQTVISTACAEARRTFAGCTAVNGLSMECTRIGVAAFLDRTELSGGISPGILGMML